MASLTLENQDGVNHNHLDELKEALEEVPINQSRILAWIQKTSKREEEVASRMTSPKTCEEPQKMEANWEFQDWIKVSCMDELKNALVQEPLNKSEVKVWIEKLEKLRSGCNAIQAEHQECCEATRHENTAASVDRELEQVLSGSSGARDLAAVPESLDDIDEDHLTNAIEALRQEFENGANVRQQTDRFRMTFREFQRQTMDRIRNRIGSATQTLASATGRFHMELETFDERNGIFVFIPPFVVFTVLKLILVVALALLVLILVSILLKLILLFVAVSLLVLIFMFLTRQS